LVHGNEIIAGRVIGYDLTKRRRTTDHSFDRIRQAILEVCGGRCEQDLQQFAGYLILDALVGNTDRHHENWALLRSDTAQGVAYRLAPSFDHASSLGREMLDERRLLLLRENRIRQYIEAGRGAIYISQAQSDAVAPITLVRILQSTMSGAFEPWFSNLQNVTMESLDSILNRVPDGWMSGPQRDFAKALVLEAKNILTGLRQ
jgi:hypothetical protein